MIDSRAGKKVLADPTLEQRQYRSETGWLVQIALFGLRCGLPRRDAVAVATDRISDCLQPGTGPSYPARVKTPIRDEEEFGGLGPGRSQSLRAWVARLTPGSPAGGAGQRRRCRPQGTRARRPEGRSA